MKASSKFDFIIVGGGLHQQALGEYVKSRVSTKSSPLLKNECSSYG